MNGIRGFFQQLKDVALRFMYKNGGADHFTESAFPHSQSRHVAQGNSGSFNTYAGGSGGGRQAPTSMQCYQAVRLLRRARIVDQQAAFDYNELIGEMDS